MASDTPWDGVDVIIEAPDPGLPFAKWTGQIMGVRVAVLSDGRRIIDVEDIDALFQKIGSDDFDYESFSEAIARFNAGELPK